MTMEKDGQHDPTHPGALLVPACEPQSQLVHASPTNAPPHSAVRNARSAFANWMLGLLCDDSDHDFVDAIAARVA